MKAHRDLAAHEIAVATMKCCRHQNVNQHLACWLGNFHSLHCSEVGADMREDWFVCRLLVGLSSRLLDVHSQSGLLRAEL